MEDLPADQDDIDFSIISPGNDKLKQLDFSVNDLLQNRENQSNSSKLPTQPNPTQQIIVPEGSFMKDLEKMEKSLSYETNPYDIYQPEEQLAQFTGTFEAKQEDTCTKTTNNITKLGEKNLQLDFKHLIVDFTEEKFGKLKTKETYEDYFDILPPAKKINQKQHSSKAKYASQSSKILTPRIKTSNSQVSLKSKQKSIHKETSTLKKVSLNKNHSQKKLRKKKAEEKQPNSKAKCKQRSESKSRSKNKADGKQRVSKLQSEVYSEYFGFQEEKRISQDKRKKGSKKSTSKGKKIVYSNKNVNLYH